VKKQWTAKWPYIANALFRIIQNHGEKVTYVGFRGAIALWIRPCIATPDHLRIADEPRSTLLFRPVRQVA